MAIALTAMLLATSCGARSEMSREQRRECRRLRAKAAFTGLGVTVGMAVAATALIVVAVATKGNVGSGGGGGSRRRARRRARRQHRHEVCYQLPNETPDPADIEAEPVQAPPPAPTAPAPPEGYAQGQAPAAQGQPPNDEVLVATFQGIEPEVRACLGEGKVVQIDLAIDGPRGVVTGYAINGMDPTTKQSECVGEQLARLRFQPFADELRVRLAVDLDWVPPPAEAPSAPAR